MDGSLGVTTTVNIGCSPLGNPYRGVDLRMVPTGTGGRRSDRAVPSTGGRSEGPCGRTVDTISALAIFGDTAIAVTSPKSNGSNILYG